MPFALLIATLLAAPSIDVSVGAGADSNPYEMPSDSGGANADFGRVGGAFVPVEGRLRWRTRAAPMRMGIIAAFDGEFFTWTARPPEPLPPLRARDLNRYDAEVALPFVFDPMRRGGFFHADLTIEPRGALARSTYTSHRTGRPLVVDAADDPESDPPLLVSLARRYDTNEAGVEVEVDASFGDLVGVVLGARVRQVDYVEDYDEIDGIDSLDHRELRGEAGLVVSPGDWVLAGGYVLRLLDYRERFPHEEDGSEVRSGEPGYEPQRFAAHHASAKAGWVSDGGRFVLRWRSTRRVDLYSGYLDYTEHRVAADLRSTAGSSVELRLAPSYSVRTYDELRVRYDPDEPVSSRRKLAAEASVEWSAFSPSTRFFLAAAAESSIASNPLYTYSAVRAWSGVRVRIR